MNQRQYARLAAFFALHPGLKALLIRLCELLPRSMMLLYPLMLSGMLIGQKAIPWLQFLCPALTLAGTELLRRLCPRLRPFEVFDFPPLIPHRPGGSFPSRHSASALAIALTAWTLHPALGIVLALLALIIGATRILTGLHFPRDVAAGYGLALIIGLPCLFFL